MKRKDIGKYSQRMAMRDEAEVEIILRTGNNETRKDRTENTTHLLYLFLHNMIPNNSRSQMEPRAFQSKKEAG
jgi:hypothetical protein